MATIKVLRTTAKLLLVTSPLMLLSGFLTAKPYLMEALGFQTTRLLHTSILPILFVPLLLVHSTAGIWYLLGRNKKLKQSSIRYAAAACWILLILALSTLYFIAQPPPDETSLAGLYEEPDAGSPDGDVEPEVEDARIPRIVDSDGLVMDGDGSANPMIDSGAIESSASEISPVKSPSKRRRPIKKRPQKHQRPQKTQPPSHKSPDAGNNEKIQQDEPTRLKGSTVTSGKCGGCHPLSTVYAKKRTAADWNRTVARMIGMGAQLTPEERSAVLRHLIARAGLREE